MIRMLFLLHRYLGIAIGLLMLAWCLSGFVMMYVQYPELSEQQQLRNLPALDTRDCCRVPETTVLADLAFSRIQVEMLADRPVMRLQDTAQRSWTVDLRSGTPLSHVGADQAAELARDFAARRGLPADPDQVLLESDQWTVTGAYNRHRPLYRFAGGDEAATQWYISSSTGEIVQMTTASQRFWNYLGAVVHWLYPTLIRQNPVIWAQAVIWLSITGGFLTLTGMYIGLRQLGRGARGRASPYRGIALWHHYMGLVFGVLTLSWVLSGTLSMNPWGLLEGSGGGSAAAQRIRGSELQWADAQSLLFALRRAELSADSVRLELNSLRGEPAVLLHQVDGRRQRLSISDLAPAPLLQQDLQELGRVLLGGAQPLAAQTLMSGDAYYYQHHIPRQFPVYRILGADEQKSRYYLDPVSGQLLAYVDREGRWYRWLFNGLHRLDFSELLRSRPLWDMLLYILLGGATVVCATGFYMGVRRLTRNAGNLKICGGQKTRKVS